ncbi:MAG: hypothetical protein J6Y56_02845 [Fibrobacterales bacterium]|nr:hypothetical protein [Fibrobacterales bacterium]
MKTKTLALIAFTMFCQPTFAKSPVLLAKDPLRDRTNHPVLFVHGLGSNAAGTWNVRGQKPYCETPRLRTDIAPRIVEGTETWKEPLDHWYACWRHGTLAVEIEYPFLCENMPSRVFWGGRTVVYPIHQRSFHECAGFSTSDFTLSIDKETHRLNVGGKTNVFYNWGHNCGDECLGVDLSRPDRIAAAQASMENTQQLIAKGMPIDDWTPCLTTATLTATRRAKEACRG